MGPQERLSPPSSFPFAILFPAPLQLPVLSSRVCPPGQANMKEKREWCYDNEAKTVTPKECCKKCSEVGPTYCQFWQHYVG